MQEWIPLVCPRSFWAGKISDGRRSAVLPDGEIYFPGWEVRRTPALPRGKFDSPLGKSGGHRHFPRGEFDSPSGSLEVTGTSRRGN